MELRVLRYFLVLVNEENITKAADILHITQPTLSRQLMELEEELGAQLFIRGKSRITLTEEGRLLRRRAEEIVDMADKTAKEFSEQNQLLEGEICIGAAETYSMHALAKVMKQFSLEYPNIKYNLYSGYADDIKERIDKGLIDIGLFIEPVNIDKYEYIRLPRKEKWGALIRKDHPLAQKEYVTPEDFIGAPVLISKRSMVQKELKNWFGANYERMNIIAVFNLIYNAAVMVEEGLGSAITIEKLVNFNEESRICFKPFDPVLESGAVIVWKKHQVLSKATSKFVDQIKNSFEQEELTSK